MTASAICIFREAISEESLRIRQDRSVGAFSGKKSKKTHRQHYSRSDRVKEIEKLPPAYPENRHQGNRRKEVMDFVKSGVRFAELEMFGKVDSERIFYNRAVREVRQKHLPDARICIVTRKGKVIAENLNWRDKA